MYSHDSPPQQPEVPHYDAPFLPGANAAPSPMAPPPVAPSPGEKKTAQSRLKPPFLPEVQKTKTPPIPRTSQRALSPRKKRRGINLWIKIVLALAVILLAVSGFFVLHLKSSNDNHPALTVVQNFYKDMKQQRYREAYGYVGVHGLRDRFLAISSDDIIYFHPEDFANACKAIDQQKGKITSFSVTGFNSIFNWLNDPVTASVTVSRRGQSYTANIGLVQEGQSWKIDYVDNL